MDGSAEIPKKNLPAKPDVIDTDVGTPKYSRRLSDKVLAAFNHAYAVGELEVAASLREVLARLDNAQAELDPHQRRDSAIALSQADLWIEFVEARNDYRAACDTEASDPIALDCMLEVMKSAYHRWATV
ncbi:MAG: hypothetical protein JJ899_13495 [Alphaproteobacteria bacterium]|nr:hypothetical protein [Alphaproteobacteria bacterium]